MASSPAPPTRFVALDIRANAVKIGAVDARQHVALTPRLVALGTLESWGRLHLRPYDAVVIAAPSCVWQLHDQLAPLVASITIAHPQLASIMPSLRASAGARDTIALARLHAAGLVPALWAPPEVRDLRALTALRRRMLDQRSAARTLLHQLLRRYRLTPPGADRLAADRPDWWETRVLAPDDRLRARAGLYDLSRAAALLAEAETDLERRASEQPWRAPAAALLRDIPGMRLLDAIILLAEIGAVARFPSAGQLAAYAGLTGNAAHCARDGQREIRSTMLEIARASVRDHGTWQTIFATLEQRVGRDRASIATARKLLLLVWGTLTTYIAVDDQQVQRAA